MRTNGEKRTTMTHIHRHLLTHTRRAPQKQPRTLDAPADPVRARYNPVLVPLRLRAFRFPLTRQFFSLGNSSLRHLFVQ